MRKHRKFEVKQMFRWTRNWSSYIWTDGVSENYVKIGKIIEIREKDEEAWGQNNVKSHARLHAIESNAPKGIVARVTKQAGMT